MIKVGDRVKFLSDTGTGIVRTLEGGVATVEVEDGFEIPAMLTDLVAVDEEAEAEARRKIGTGDEKPGRRGRAPQGDGQERRPKRPEGEVRYGKISLVDDYEDEDLVDLARIREQYLRNVTVQNEKEIAAERKALQAEGFQLPQEENVSEPLQQQSAPEPEKPKMRKVQLEELSGARTAPDPVSPPKKNDNDPEVIDLHADEILDSTQGLTAGEILDAQLSRFTIALDLALQNRQKGKMVFIHGVGSGKLKYEMKKVLERRYPKLNWQDASFREYGYGAILVLLP